jgi:uncharacterized repeat protein (TIGR01451 family)
LRIRAPAALVGAAVVAALVLPVGAGASSLYDGPGPRPGPDILYEPVANAPQLQNAGSWQAPPVLVSGTSAYRDGEFLYQDWIYDDSGALGTASFSDGRFLQSNSKPAGTYMYPTDNSLYANDAADFVELRVKPVTGATAFRITLNTMKPGASDLVAATIAIGGTPGVPRAWPHGANVSSPAALFLTVHGTTADLLDAVSGLPVTGPAPTASVDTTRRQITVTVPHASWDPTGQVVRLAAGVGLWNTTSGNYRVPTPEPSSTNPGGAGSLASPPALFNVAFRFECQQEDPLPPGSVPAGCEPMPNVQHPDVNSDPSWWRDNTQAHALAGGDISQFFANVDFNKLALETDDDMPGQFRGVPQTGPMDRIGASHFEPEQGLIYPSCSGTASISANACTGWLRGRLQPYAVYVPQQPMPAGGYGLTLLLHSLSANYNQYLGSNNQSQFGERGPGSIVITPSGRGPDSWYYSYAASDAFEMWADVATRYQLDPEWTAIAGYSMGGYGTYKLGAQFPDLFAKGQPTVGPPGQGIWNPPSDPGPGGARSNTNRMLKSFRNVPFLMWYAAQDELVPVAGAQAQANTFDSLGYRYEFDLFDPATHNSLARNDEYGPAATFLGTTEVDRDPAHITYTYNPTMDFATGQLAADHAYWLSGITLRDGSGTAPLGTIDVRSHGFGVGDPTPSATQTGSGVLTGGGLGDMSFSRQFKTWGSVPTTPVANRLDINATNISSVTISAARARVGCDAQLNVTSDGPPPTVNLVDCEQADLSVIKSDSPDPILAGQELTYTVSISNAGPSATGATLTDTLPAAVTYVSATPSSGTCGESGGVVTCGLGTLASGGVATVTIKVQPQSAGTIVNSATVSGTVADPDSSDNTDTESTTVDSTLSCNGAAATIVGTSNNETINGTSGNDVIVGLEGNDTINGLGGNDKICGGPGNDTLNGGGNADTMSGGSGLDNVTYAARTSTVTVSIDGVANDGSATDGPAGARDNVTTDVENLIGGTAADTLTGSAGDNNLDGGGGPDVLSGLGGGDTVSYINRTVGVTVTIDDVANDGNSDDGQTDNVKTDVEHLIGGSGADTLTGSSVTNRLDGRNGADILSGLGGGDTVTYAKRTSGVTVDPDGVADDGNAADGPAGSRDNVMADVENITGSGGADTLTGSSAKNKLTGGLGADVLIGLGANDELFANDGVADSQLNCDGGSSPGAADIAHVDGLDPPTIGCETVGP